MCLAMVAIVLVCVSTDDVDLVVEAPLVQLNGFLGNCVPRGLLVRVEEAELPPFLSTAADIACCGP